MYSLHYRTLFTGVERYNYIDPDYAFDDMEIEMKKKKELMYLKEINKLQKKQEIKKMKRYTTLNLTFFFNSIILLETFIYFTFQLVLIYLLAFSNR